MAWRDLLFEGQTFYRFEQTDVLMMLYRELAVTAFVDDAAIANGTTVPVYRHEGMVHIAEGTLALEPLP